MNQNRAILCGCSGVFHRSSPKSRDFFPGEKKAHKHKLLALVNVQMALGQTAGCPGFNRAKKFMCLPRNIGNINFSLWLTGGLSQGCPDFQKVWPPKNLGMAKFKRTFAQTLRNILRAPHMKMRGFEAQKRQKVHPNFATNIAMEFHCHAVCTPD